MGKPVPTRVGEWGRRGEDKSAVNICLVGYNICNGRNGGLESALNAMVQANMDLRVLFKTNITGGGKMCRSSGYSVVASEVPIKHQGGKSILFKNSLHWKIKVHQAFGPNVLRFQIVTGWTHWFVGVWYALPYSRAETKHITTVLVHCPKSMELTLVSNLNVELCQLEGRDRDEEFAAMIIVKGLKDMVAHFWPQQV